MPSPSKFLLLEHFFFACTFLQNLPKCKWSPLSGAPLCQKCYYEPIFLYDILVEDTIRNVIPDFQEILQLFFNTLVCL